MTSHRNPKKLATALLVLGFGCYASFLIGLMSLPILFADGSFARDHEGLAALVAGIVSLVLCFSFPTLRNKYRSTFFGKTGRIVLGISVCLLALTQCLSLIPQQPIPLPYFLTAFLYALIGLQLTAMWGYVCEGFPLPTLHRALPAAMIVSVFIGVGLHFLSLWLQTPEGFLSFLAPTASFLFLISLMAIEGPSGDSACDEKRLNLTSVTKSCGILAAAILAVYILSSGVFYSIYTDGMQNYSLRGATHKAIVLIFTSFLLIVPWLADRKRINSAVTQTTICFIPFCLIALYCTVAFEGSLLGIARGIVLPTRACAMFLILMIIVELSFEENYSLPDLAVSICLPLIFFSRAIMFDAWKILSEAEKAIPPNSLMAIFVLMSVLVMLFGTFWMLLARQKHFISPSDPDPIRDTSSLAEDYLTLLQEQHGLSLREAEVISYIAQGYTKKKIAEVLFLSVNSVSTYTKSAYSKLGVHKRQEVIDLMKEHADRVPQARPERHPSEEGSPRF